MKVEEVKVVFDGDEISKIQKEICELFYSFGVTGLKIEEPMKEKNPLDFYKDEKKFLMVDNAVSAYFPMNQYAKKREEMIKNEFDRYFHDREDIIYTIDFYEYDEKDYQDNWKKYFFTEKISKRFVIKPTWRQYEPQEDELVIEIDPGLAFGTGTHPTTSLCIKLMEKYIKLGNSIIDVGTGSGILMIAARKLGADRVLGIDIDEMAVDTARENLARNHIIDNKAEVIKGDLISSVPNEKFDIAVANILSDVLIILLKDIAHVIKEDGMMIFSGIIDEKYDMMIEQIEAHGFKPLETLKDGEWRSIIAKNSKEN